MNWYAAAKVLHDRAEYLRSRDHGLTPGQIEAARQALRIFSSPALDAIREAWVAEALDEFVKVFERRGRDEETPTPVPVKR